MWQPVQTILVLILFIASTVNSSAFDPEREKRLREQTLAALFTGEPVFLSTPENEFLTLETQAQGDIKGVIILLHGRGYGPDSQTVVGPLREAFAENGWQTLSVQLPVLEKGAKYYDYIDVFPNARDRISAALSYIHQSEISPVVLLAHSCGVHMSMDWIRHNGDNLIDAYIGLGMGATDYQQPMLEQFPFSTMTVPILDLYGDADYPAVVTKADERWQAFKHANSKSKQVVIAQANHEFNDHNDAVIESVSQWLDGLK